MPQEHVQYSLLNNMPLSHTQFRTAIGSHSNKQDCDKEEEESLA